MQDFDENTIFGHSKVSFYSFFFFLVAFGIALANRNLFLNMVENMMIEAMAEEDSSCWKNINIKKKKNIEFYSVYLLSRTHK
jgi:hypothetical protein